MNSFLERLAMLEGKMPNMQPYQKSIMQVFTSMLDVAAIAAKFSAKGRLSKSLCNRDLDSFPS